MESNIIEHVRRIILQRSLSFNENLPDVGNFPIFPDRLEYKVEIQLINQIIWVELLRDQFPIDAFEIVVQDDKVICIDHPIISDSILTPTSSYPRERFTEFPIYQWEFLVWGKQHARKEKLKRLSSQEL